MKKITVVSLFLLLPLSLFAIADQQKGSWTGRISDAKCAEAGKKHDAACVQKCLTGGGKAVLVVGKDIYAITNADAIKGHEGHNVKVTGSLDKEKKEITVQKVEMAAEKGANKK